MAEDYSKLNSSLDKMADIMGITDRKMSFDAVIIECDPDYAVIKARKIIEGICRYLVVINRLIKEENSIKNATLEVYLKQFLRIREDLFPKNIIIKIETIQKYGNYGGHFQTGGSISAQDVNICLSALGAILDWFNEEYEIYSKSSHITDADKMIEPEDGNRDDNGKTGTRKEWDRKQTINFSNLESVSHEEIAIVIRQLSRKFSYNIYERIHTKELYEQFCEFANRMSKNSVEIYNHGKLVGDIDDKIAYIIRKLEAGQKIIQVRGLPGTGKNMLLQLVFYNMLQKFADGSSRYIPLYISVNYYEKLIYDPGDVYQQIKDVMKKDIEPYIHYVKENKDLKPVLFIDAVREHQISDIIVENVLNELSQPLGRASLLSLWTLG